MRVVVPVLVTVSMTMVVTMPVVVFVGVHFPVFYVDPSFFRTLITPPVVGWLTTRFREFVDAAPCHCQYQRKTVLHPKEALPR
jgi:hypothetical protein